MTFIIRFGDEVDPTPPPKKKKPTKKKAPAKEAPAKEAPASEAPAKKDFGAQAKEILTNAKKTYKSDAGNDVAFTTAISADPKSSEYRSAFGDLTKQIEALQKREAVVEAKKKQEEDEKKKKETKAIMTSFVESPEEAANILTSKSVRKRNSAIKGVARTISNNAPKVLEKLKKLNPNHPLVGLLEGFGLTPEEQAQKEEDASQVRGFQTLIQNGLMTPEERLSKEVEIEERISARKQALSARRQDAMREIIATISQMFPKGGESPFKGIPPQDIPSILLGESEKAREILSKNPSLQLLSASIKSSPPTKEIKKKVEPPSEGVAEAIRAKFKDKIKAMLPRGAFGGVKDEKEMGVDEKRLNAILDEVYNLPDEQLDDAAEGFVTQSSALSKIISDESLSESQRTEKILELTRGYDGAKSLNSLTGAELGAQIASSAIEAAFVTNYDDIIEKTFDRVYFSSKETTGTASTDETVISSVRNEVVEKLKAGDSDIREQALQHYQEQLSKTRATTYSNQTKSRRRVALEAAIDGVIVAKLLAGEDIPPDRYQPESFFLNLAKQGLKDPDLFTIIAESTRTENRLPDGELREKKRKFIEDLSDDNFVAIAGGDSGPFSPLLEVMDDGYCPNLPANGDMAGQKLGPNDICPVRMSPEVRNNIKEFITDTILDAHNISPSSEDNMGGGNRGKGKNKGKGKEQGMPEMQQYLQRNKDEILKALTYSDKAKQEEAITFILMGMRQKALENLEIPGFDPKTTPKDDVKRVEEGKRSALVKLIQEYNKAFGTTGATEKKKEILGLIEEVQNANKTPSRKTRGFDDDDDFSFRFGSVLTDRLFMIERLLYAQNRALTTMFRQATQYVDYQARARLFKPGTLVFPFYGGNADMKGVVLAVYPAIGMVDVQFPHGATRLPVEDLQIHDTPTQGIPDSVPGGLGVVPVSGGPSSSRVASAYLHRMRMR